MVPRSIPIAGAMIDVLFEDLKVYVLCRGIRCFVNVGKLGSGGLGREREKESWWL